MCPYAFPSKSAIWEKFYEINSPKELGLINFFKGGMGYFEFLVENDPFGVYEQARYLVIEDIFEALVEHYDITINWDNIVIL